MPRRARMWGIIGVALAVSIVSIAINIASYITLSNRLDDEQRMVRKTL